MFLYYAMLIINIICTSGAITMKFNFLILFFLLPILYAQDASNKVIQECVTIDKANLTSTLKDNTEILLRTRRVGNEIYDIAFNLDTPNNDEYFTLYCEHDSKEENNYICTIDDTLQKVQINTINKKISSINLEYFEIPVFQNSLTHRFKGKIDDFGDMKASPCYKDKNAIFDLGTTGTDSKKEKYLKAITLKNIIVYDLAYKDNLVIALAEDNSVEFREEYYALETMRDHEIQLAPILLKSIDNGKNWEKIDAPIYDTNYYITVEDNKTIVLTQENDWQEQRISKDAGKTWKREYKSADNTHVSTQIKNYPLLELPTYKIDKQTNELILRHKPKGCFCKEFSLPLIYRESNQNIGILGVNWAFAVESYIQVKDEKSLVYFDAQTAKFKTYMQDSNNPLHYYHELYEIKKTDTGYTSECDSFKEHFNKDGKLVKLDYPDHSFTLHYKDNKLDKIYQLKGSEKELFVSFDYLYEGVSITLHFTKEKNTLTYLKNKDGLLTRILDGNKLVYHYLYDGNLLSEVINMQLKEQKSVLEVFRRENRTILYGYNVNNNPNVSTTDTYIFHTKGNEHTCIVNSLSQTKIKSPVPYLDSDTKVYRYTYKNSTKNHLTFTQHGNDMYGYDEKGRLNFHSYYDRNTTLTFTDFNKIAKSKITQNSKNKTYRYTYSDDKYHNLISLVSDTQSISIKYNKDQKISHLKTGSMESSYEYNNKGQMIRIILKDMGEINVTYTNDNEISETKTKLYNDKATSHELALGVTRAMQYILKIAKEQKLKSYPRWVD